MNNNHSMAYIGGLNKAQFAALLTDQLKPFVEKVAVLEKLVDDLQGQLSGRGKEMYTIDDLCTLFKVSKATVHNWVKKGQLIKYKMGARSLFKREEVEKIINYSKSI